MEERNPQCTREVFLEEAKCVAWLSLDPIVPYASSEIVKLSLVLLEGR